MPKRVFVCSPLRAETSEGYAKNIQIARELTRAVLLAGHAPFTPHLWYSTHLDDTRPEQRAMGMAAGAAWLRVADEIWVYAADEFGCSAGMKKEIALAGQLSLPVRVVWMPECFAEVKVRHVADNAVREIQAQSQQNGAAQLTNKEIDDEIAAARAARQPAPPPTTTQLDTCTRCNAELPKVRRFDLCENCLALDPPTTTEA